MRQTLEFKGSSYIEHVTDAIQSLDNDYFEACLEQAKALILLAKENDKRVHITGIGKPSYVAKYCASLFSSTGTMTYFLDATECVHGSAGQVSPSDVVIAISNSGKTEELMRSVDTLLANHAILIGVSSNRNSPLAMRSHVHLEVGVEAEGDRLNKPPRASIIAEMVTLQILSIKLQYARNLTMDEYLRWHPGGAIGETDGSSFDEN